MPLTVTAKAGATEYTKLNRLKEKKIVSRIFFTINKKRNKQKQKKQQERRERLNTQGGESKCAEI